MSLVYCFTNLNFSIICFLFPEDVYFSFVLSISFSSAFECNSFEELCGHFEILVILPDILLRIKSQVASAVFWVALFE